MYTYDIAITIIKRRCVCVWGGWIAFGVLENCVPFKSPRNRLIRRGGVTQRLCGPSEGRMALQHNSGDIEISPNEIRHCYENTNWDLQLDFRNNRIISDEGSSGDQTIIFNQQII